MRIESNIKDIIKGLNNFEKKQMPYIAQLTTNNIAFDVLNSHKREIATLLNWKKRTPNALRIKKASKSKPYAEIYIDEKNWGFYALEQHYKGGDRHRKGLEKALISKGLLNRSEILVPSPGANIRTSTYKIIMTQLKLHRTTQTDTKKKSKASSLKYFIITSSMKSHLSPGVYATMTSNTSPICILKIASKPNYDKRFDLKRAVELIYKKNGERHFKNAYDMAMRTARW